MQIHMFWFVDGGILNGTPNQEINKDYLLFQSQIDSSFIACILLIIFVALANFGNYIV